MRLLSKQEFFKTFIEPIHKVEDDKKPLFDFWNYVESIPEDDFDGHDCKDGNVSHAWNLSNQYQHVLIESEDINIFMVIILNLRKKEVFGHYLLDLNLEYGLNSNLELYGEDDEI